MYPLTSAALGVLPVLLITLVFGGDLLSLVSPEASLFYCMFIAFGLVFGTGFSPLYR